MFNPHKLKKIFWVLRNFKCVKGYWEQKAWGELM